MIPSLMAVGYPTASLPMSDSPFPKISMVRWEKDLDKSIFCRVESKEKGKRQAKLRAGPNFPAPLEFLSEYITA